MRRVEEANYQVDLSLDFLSLPGLADFFLSYAKGKDAPIRRRVSLLSARTGVSADRYLIGLPSAIARSGKSSQDITRAIFQYTKRRTPMLRDIPLEEQTFNQLSGGVITDLALLQLSYIWGKEAYIDYKSQVRSVKSPFKKLELGIEAEIDQLERLVEEDVNLTKYQRNALIEFVRKSRLQLENAANIEVDKTSPLAQFIKANGPAIALAATVGIVSTRLVQESGRVRLPENVRRDNVPQNIYAWEATEESPLATDIASTTSPTPSPVNEIEKVQVVGIEVTPTPNQVNQLDTVATSTPNREDPVAPGIKLNPTSTTEPIKRPTEIPNSTPTATPTVAPINTLAVQPIPTSTPEQATKVTHVVVSGETLTQIAERYGVSIDSLVSSNGIEDRNLIIVGQVLTIPNGQRGSVDTPPSLNGPTRTLETTLDVSPSSPDAVTMTALDSIGAELSIKYKNQLFRSLSDMPEELRTWYVGKVVEISQKFNFPPEMVLAIHWAEQRGAGFRPFESRSSYASTAGPGQWTPRSWNGWSNPERTKFVMDPVEIIKWGGYGIDYKYVDLWLKAEAGDEEALNQLVLLGSRANPTDFESNVAATIRHLESDMRGARDDNALTRAANHYVGGDALYVKQVIEQSKVIAKEISGQVVLSFEESLSRAYDKAFGFMLSQQSIDDLVENTFVQDAKAGKISYGEAIVILINEQRDKYMAEGVKDSGVSWPHFKNKEYADTQEAAVYYLGHMLSHEEVTFLNETHGGDIQAIRANLASRKDATLFNYAKDLIPKMYARDRRGVYTSNEEIRNLLQPIIEKRFAGLNPNQIPDELLEAAKEDLKNALLSTSECQANCPFILTAPKFGRLFAGPYKLRDVISDWQGEKGPSELHGNEDYYPRSKRMAWNWYGEDGNGTGSVLAPLTGVVEEVVANAGNSRVNGGNAVGIRGTGEYQGFYFKVLHIDGVRVSIGDIVNIGDQIAQRQSPSWAHIHAMLMFDKNKTGHPSWGYPVPMEFLFMEGAGPNGKYSSGTYREGDVPNNDALKWLYLDAINW